MEKIDEQLDNKEFEINLEEHPDASEEQEDYLYDLEYSLAEVLRRWEQQLNSDENSRFSNTLFSRIQNSNVDLQHGPKRG